MSTILWDIKATWANKGRCGETHAVAQAPDAIEALRLRARKAKRRV